MGRTKLALAFNLKLARTAAAVAGWAGCNSDLPHLEVICARTT
jgi:hypothetical protein